jgi:hypothetical protein
MFPDLPTTKNEENHAEEYLVNFQRYLYQAISLEGVVGSPYVYLNQIKNNLFIELTQKSGINLESPDYLSESTTVFSYTNRPPVNEDSSWFGLLSWLLLPVMAVVVLATKGMKLRKQYLLFSILLLLVFTFSLLLFKHGWGPNRGRYLIPPVLAISPLFASLFSLKKPLRLLSEIVVIALVFCISTSTFLFNESRTIVTKKALTEFSDNSLSKIGDNNFFSHKLRNGIGWVIADLEKTAPGRSSILVNSYYENLYFQNSSEIQNITFINKVVPEKAPIYLMINKSTIEYALFGRNRTRNLYPLIDLESEPMNGYILISNNLLHSLPDDLIFVQKNKEYSIFHSSN